MIHKFLFIVFIGATVTLATTSHADGYCYITREFISDRVSRKAQYAVYHGSFLLQYFDPANYRSDGHTRGAAENFGRQREATGDCMFLSGLHYDALSK